MSRKYESVKDYTAIYEKEESSIGKGEKQIINLSFRKPFDVRMDWLDDKGKFDQTAIYQEGKNEGKLLTKDYSLLGRLVGTVKISPDSPIAMQDSKHAITTVGFGNLIESLTADINDPQVNTAYVGEKQTVDGRAAYQIEITGQANINSPGLAGVKRIFILIDKQLLLPVKVEIYDGNEDLLERHLFRNVKLNPNLNDKTFEI